MKSFSLPAVRSGCHHPARRAEWKRVTMWSLATVLAALAPSAWSGTEGTFSTFYGHNAGADNGSDANDNSFFGSSAGVLNTSGTHNTFLGFAVGATNTTGSDNTFAGFSIGTTTGSNNSFFGSGAGHLNASGGNNSFVGYQAGYSNDSGNFNVYLGDAAGYSSTLGGYNTLVGAGAGYYMTGGTNNVYVGYSTGSHAQGSSNVFLGYNAGTTESGSNRLYIDNCLTGYPCTAPLVYGEFDNHRVRLNGMTEVHYNGQAKSQLNFSQSSTDTGGYLTSVLDNNFFTSSGARYDGTLAPPNQWVQRSADGNSVIAGSGGAGYRIFTSSGNSQNTAFAPTVRLHINYAGEFGINQAPVAGHEIHTLAGAYEAGGSWVNGSSRELKENISRLSPEEASQALAALDPIKFNYKTDTAWQHVGFIAEDVPELVASPDRKGLSPMDIVAVLTKVVQEQTQQLAEQREQLRANRDSTEERLQQLAAEVARLRARVGN
jgi:hypothetical protein